MTRIWRWAGFSRATTGTGRPPTPAIAEHWTWNPATPRPSGAPAVQALTLGRWSEAIDLANKAIERDPLRPDSYSNLGFALLAVNRDTEAEAAFRKALELDPDGAVRHMFLGRALLLQGKADAALQEQAETDSWRLSRRSHFRARRRDESPAAATWQRVANAPTRSPKCMPSGLSRLA